MALYEFVFLLVICLLLSLVLLWRLDWFPRRPATSEGAAKRTKLPRLRHRHAPQMIAPPVVSSPRPL